MRCAIVGSGTMNARAISGVERPPSRRRVSAICAAGARAGWQQVKINRRRSSGTADSSSMGSSVAASSAVACSWRSRCEASLRSRSRIRRRAVVMIHPAGLGGKPSSGHRCAATMKASCTPSSARSKSPKARMRTETARPYSPRKMRSISGPRTGSAEVTTGAPPGRAALQRARRMLGSPSWPNPARRRGPERQ